MPHQPSRPRPPVPAGLILTALLAACATGAGTGAGPDASHAGSLATAPASGEPSVAVAPQGGPPGAAVRVSASGFPPDAAVELGAGPWRSEFEVLERARTGPEGGLEATVALPQYADPGDRWVFVVQTTDHRLDARSAPFRVTAQDDGGRAGPGPGAEPQRGTVEVTGVLTDDGVECPALRGDDGRLYTLAGGDLAGLQPGDRVRVVGTVAEMSFCMQGTTVAVERIEAP